MKLPHQAMLLELFQPAYKYFSSAHILGFKLFIQSSDYWMDGQQWWQNDLELWQVKQLTGPWSIAWYASAVRWCRFSESQSLP